MLISDWSSDVCSSVLLLASLHDSSSAGALPPERKTAFTHWATAYSGSDHGGRAAGGTRPAAALVRGARRWAGFERSCPFDGWCRFFFWPCLDHLPARARPDLTGVRGGRTWVSRCSIL